MRSVIIALFVALTLTESLAAQRRHLLYIAVPGSDADAGDGRGLGILVFDIDNNHKFVRRISPSLRSAAAGEHARGISVHVGTRRLYLSTSSRLVAIDLTTDRVIWESSFDGQCCDRLDVSPDGRTIYAPAFGKPAWYVVNAVDGTLTTTIGVTGFPRQTIYARDGKHAYLAAWESSVISLVDTSSHKVIREVGPFSGSVCPFAINDRGTLAFANVDGLVGFEIGDLQTGLALDRVIVDDSDTAEWAKYECPSHGIAITPDGREVWLANGVENRLYVYDATIYPPAFSWKTDIAGQPRWITFSNDGRYAYVSTGVVIDRTAKKVVATLEDEAGIMVQSGKMVATSY